AGNYSAIEGRINRTTIQAAIDYAYNHRKQVVQLPCGATFWYDDTLYLDSPKNHSGQSYNAVDFGFSLMLRGCGGQGNYNQAGTHLWPGPGLNAPYLVVGHGQGMTVQGLTIWGTTDPAHSEACAAVWSKRSV